MITTQTIDKDELLDLIVDVCADHFDVDFLSPDAIVSKIAGDPKAMTLIGWSTEKEGWICNDVDDGEIIVIGEKLVDPYMVRRVVGLMFYRRHVQFRWEVCPIPIEKVQEIEEEVLARLGADGLIAI